MQRLDLLGSAVSLGGKGEMDLDGSNLAMDFYAVWGHVTQMLPPGLRDVPPWLSKNLLLIEARGKLGGQLAVRPIPVADRWSTRSGNSSTRPRAAEQAGRPEHSCPTDPNAPSH